MVNRQSFRGFAQVVCVAVVVAFSQHAGFSAQVRRPSPVDSIHTEIGYFRALAAADSLTFFSDFEPYFLLILEPGERAAYDSLDTLRQRKAFIKGYWDASNPNPLLPENDWLLDFIRRVAFSRQQFPSPEPPFIDDRGYYYIKFGKPRSRLEDAGGIVRLEVSNNFRAREYFGLRNPINYTVAPSETWSYANIHRDFVVYFMREGSTFREIRDLKALLIRKMDIRQIRRHEVYNIYWFWGDLIKKRAALSPALGEAYNKVMEAEENIITRLMAFEAPHVTLLRTESETAHALERARDELPAAAHDPVQAENKVKFTDRVTQWRDANGATRVEIDFLVPLKKNLVKRFTATSTDTVEIGYSAMLRDARYRVLMRNDAFQQFPIALAAIYGLSRAAGRVVLHAPPQPAELTLQVRETRAMRRDRYGYFKRALQLRNFSGDSLMLSDVQVNYRLTDRAQRLILPANKMESVWVSPYPYEKIRKDAPPLLYFEIYNARPGEVEIAYTLRRLEKSTPVVDLFSGKKERVAVSASYLRPVSGPHMYEFIELDLHNTGDGAHLLEIAVRSPTQPQRVARTQTVLEIE